MSLYVQLLFVLCNCIALQSHQQQCTVSTAAFTVLNMYTFAFKWYMSIETAQHALHGQLYIVSSDGGDKDTPPSVSSRLGSNHQTNPSAVPAIQKSCSSTSCSCRRQVQLLRKQKSPAAAPLSASSLPTTTA